MRKLTLSLATFYLICFALVSCKKETIKNESYGAQKEILKSTNLPIPTFKNYEELNSKIEELNAMEEYDRRIFENNTGFKSLLTYVYEIYEGIDMEKLESKKQLEEFVAKNANIVSLQTNNDNEVEYRPFYVDVDYSIIANTNRMFIVDDQCYKIFDDGIIIGNKKNLGLLASLDQIFVKDVPKNDNYEIISYEKMEINGKSSCHPTHNEASVTNGAQRTKITLIATQKQYGEIPATPSTSKIKVYGVSAFGRVRPYKRTLGIWYHCKRTISGRVQFSVTWKDGTVQRTKSLNQSFSQIYDWSVTRSINEYSLPFGEKPKEIKFSVIDSWGDTPSTSVVTRVCN